MQNSVILLKYDKSVCYNTKGRMLIV